MITWHFVEKSNPFSHGDFFWTGAAKGRLDLEGLSKVIAALCHINKIK